MQELYKIYSTLTYDISTLTFTMNAKTCNGIAYNYWSTDWSRIWKRLGKIRGIRNMEWMYSCFHAIHRYYHCCYDENENETTLRSQTGVIRTNCIDCLDRTNVVQSKLGKWMIERWQQDLGINLMEDPTFISAFNSGKRKRKWSEWCAVLIVVSF